MSYGSNTIEALDKIEAALVSAGARRVSASYVRRGCAPNTVCDCDDYSVHVGSTLMVLVGKKAPNDNADIDRVFMLP